MRSFITLYPNASAWRVSGTRCASEFSLNLSHRPINSTFKSRKCTERERKNRGELRRSTEGNVLPLSNGITRIVPIYSNRLNTSSIAREYRGIPRNFSRTSTTDFPSKMAAPLPSAPPSLANSFANRKTDFFPRSVTQTVRKISIESG